MFRLRQGGFSVIELMITVAVAAIVLSIAAPNFRDAMLRSRVSGTATELQAALSLARAEALKLKLPVTVCARATDTTCAGGVLWSDGFLLFQDPNGNGLADDGEQILRVRPFTLPNVIVRGESSSISILGNGRVAGGAERTIEVRAADCATGGVERDIGQRQQVMVSASGRASSRRLGCA
jgi:type IV fimbrial biogenesis protein FimT